MKTLSRAYDELCGIVERFANSSAGSGTASCHVENREAWYAEWGDNYMVNLLDNSLTKNLLRKIADTYYGKQLSELLSEATELSADTYPKMYATYEDCCNTLGMNTRPKAYITGRLKGINALSLEVKSEQLILISPKTATCLPPNEQSFLLGHEIGHHQQDNLVCHTVNGLLDKISSDSDIIGPLVLDTIEVPLKRWCRHSEFNADRAGYLCCRNIDSIRSLFMRLGMKSSTSAYDDYVEVGAAHPMLKTRWIVLKEYIEQNKQRH